MKKAASNSAINSVADLLRSLLFLSVWHGQRWVHRDPKLWIFGAWDGVRYSDSSRALYEYILEHHPEIRAVWMTRSEEVYSRLHRQGYPVERITSSEGRRVMRHASVLCYVEGLQDVDPRYMNGIRIVNLWHGMPLKQIGDDAMRFIRKVTWWKRFKTGVRRLVVPYEFMKGGTLSTAPFFTPFLMSAFQLPKEEVWELGLPRNDRFFSTTVDPLIQKLDEAYHRPFKILYMPTFRDACTRTGHLFDPFSQVGFDAKALNEVLESQNMVFLYKGHFCDAENKGFSTDGRLRTITDDDYDDQYAFIKDVDLLITDYSSIYFDFLLCRKPILLFPFDEEAYRKQSRPFYFDYSLMEASRVYTWSELVLALKTRNFKSPSEAEVSRFHKFVDGNTCRRLMEQLKR